VPILPYISLSLSISKERSVFFFRGRTLQSSVIGGLISILAVSAFLTYVVTQFVQLFGATHSNMDVATYGVVYDNYTSELYYDAPVELCQQEP